jgi:hypothetical protein
MSKWKKALIAVAVGLPALALASGGVAMACGAWCPFCG